MGYGVGVRVVIADDHPVVLAGLVAILRKVQCLEIVAACSEGEAALKAVLEMQPDVACLDIMMPGLTGVEVVQSAREAGSATQFVLLTGSAARSEFEAALGCGAVAIFHKDSASDELADWFINIQSQRIENKGGPDIGEGENSPNLTAREREIAMLVARGLSNKHIAREANISEGTVKIHLYNIYQKLGTSNRTELANYMNMKNLFRI